MINLSTSFNFFSCFPNFHIPSSHPSLPPVRPSIAPPITPFSLPPPSHSSPPPSLPPSSLSLLPPSLLPSPSHLSLPLSLSSIAAESQRNLMKASNLGVVFGPTLMRPERETVATIVNIKYQNIVVEVLIEEMSAVSQCVHVFTAH